jgi:hypothetical protein
MSLFLSQLRIHLIHKFFEFYKELYKNDLLKIKFALAIDSYKAAILVYDTEVEEEEATALNCCVFK